MNALFHDGCYAWRRLRKSPGFAATASLMLGLGMGLGVAMFSVLQGVVLSSLPYPGGDRVVAVTAVNPQQGGAAGGLTPAEALQLAQSDAYEAFGYYHWGGMTLLSEGQAREVRIAQVSQGYFAALGVAPLLGRVFEVDDMDGAQDGLILSHGEWQRLSGGDPEVVGRTIDTVEHGRMRVIGVMPAQFSHPSALIGAWRAFPAAAIQPQSPAHWNARHVDAVARVAAGQTGRAALERAQTVADAVRQSYAMSDVGWRLQATPLLTQVVGEAAPVLWASFAVTMLVLLIACANVAILLDARQIARSEEQAIAQALGASRQRVFRVLLLELALLGAAGALLGWVFAAGALHLLAGLAESSVPRTDEIALDGEVLLFALGVALATPILAGLLGALRLRGEVIDAMRSGGKGMATMHAARTRWLPVLGVALSTMALFAAAAMVASLLRVLDIDPGFRSEHVHVLQLGREGGPQEWASFAEQMQDKLQAMPGVSEVAVATAVPGSGLGTFRIDVAVPGRAEPEALQARLRRVSPAYLDLLSIPILAGRNFQESDRPGSERVAIINRSLAESVFGQQSPLGQVLTLPLGEGDRVPYRIVGVSADVRNEGVRLAASAEVLLPFAQEPWIAMSFLVRTSGELPGIAEQMRTAVWEIDPNEGITRQFQMDERLALDLKPSRFFARAVGGFALCALVLAGLGVYAVAAQHQQQRRAEYGLRLALGAPPARLAGQSLTASMLASGIGILAGAVGGWALLHLLRSQLFEFGSGYLPWFAAAVLGIALATLTAALPPALRAARTDPLVALRPSP